MDLKTNSASTADWVRVTQDISICAYDPGQQKTLATTQSKPTKALELPKRDQLYELPSPG